MVEVQDRSFDDPGAQALIEALELDMQERYRADDEVASPEESVVDEALVVVTAEMVAAPAGALVVAVLDGVDVGCAALRRDTTTAGDPSIPPTAEVKRMYVAPEARGHGVARALLGALEDRARAAGYERLVLETGTRQPEAVALYESWGFTPITAYGAYRASPLSLCFGKALG